MSKDSYGDICKYFGIDEIKKINSSSSWKKLLKDILHTVTRVSLDIR